MPPAEDKRLPYREPPLEIARRARSALDVCIIHEDADRQTTVAHTFSRAQHTQPPSHPATRNETPVPSMRNVLELQLADHSHTSPPTLPSPPPLSTRPTCPPPDLRGTGHRNNSSHVPARTSRLQAFLEDEAGPEQLVVVLGVRGDEAACGKVQSTAELTNRFLLQRYGLSPEGGQGSVVSPSGRASSSSSSTGERYRMVKVDFAEHQATAELYGVKALPAFLMFQGGRLAWAGTLGGSPLKSAPPNTAAAGQRVLLVEPCAKVRERSP